jgi:hypothetical protein
MTATEEDLETAWSLNPTLSSNYALDSGWILEKNRRTSDPAYSAAVESRSRDRSTKNLQQAREFAGLCVDGSVRLLAVSGGNSYSRAGPRDDVDLFCVTAKDSLWVFMLKSLLLARIYKSSRRRAAPFCFSYAMDETRAREEFRSAGDGLFARDALMARVLHGSMFYLSLLNDSRWMGGYFPNLYARRTTEPEKPEGLAQGKGSSVLNSFLFYTLGTYIRLKAFLLNGRYLKSGNTSAVFRAEVGKDKCVYESNRYKRLRRIYDLQLRSRGEARE